MKPKKTQKIVKQPSHTIIIKSIFWFSTGVCLGIFLLISFVFIIFQKSYEKVIYPGVLVNGINFGGKTPNQVKDYFAKQNEGIGNTEFVFSSESSIATISAKQLGFGYDENLLAKQVYSIGRSQDTLSNISIIVQAYTNGVQLSPSFHYSEEKLEKLLAPTAKKLHVEPVDALFNFSNGRVSAFRLSSDGQELDREKVKDAIDAKTLLIVSQRPQTIQLQIPIKILHPAITTEKVNNLGIKELIATGTSIFQGSAPERIHNVTVAASKINGALIGPNETFSFDKTLGDISQFTGFKQAYVIQNGHTVLGDGGGVCQVSTTLFRAVLNAGLPIVERHAHAYRVHYYEEDSPPGIDATIFVPTVDFRFKNDTGHSILIQTILDPNTERLTFFLYGTKDNREVTLSQPIITSQTPAPDPLYQDDPTLPRGVVKQIDFAAPGATIYFTRVVKKNGKTLISERFDSNFKAWQAVYLRGTKD